MEYNVAIRGQINTSRAEGDTDGIGELVDAGLEIGPGALIEGDLLGPRPHHQVTVFSAADRPLPEPHPSPQARLC